MSSTSGLQPLVAQRGALLDAEAMLLVDDDEPQLVERHRLLHERVCPDDEMGRAALDVRRHGVLLKAGRAAGEQIHAEPGRGQQPRDIREMLIRQDLRGRHERDLQPVLHRDDRRQQRHDRLPCPDIALKQSMHRRRASACRRRSP